MEIEETMLFFPPNRRVVVVGESCHGHYDEDGTYTKIPLEVRPYNHEMSEQE